MINVNTYKKINYKNGHKRGSSLGLRIHRLNSYSCEIHMIKDTIVYSQ